jgi:hypothetical protein
LLKDGDKVIIVARHCKHGCRDYSWHNGCVGFTGTVWERYTHVTEDNVPVRIEDGMGLNRTSWCNFLSQEVKIFSSKELI